MADVDDVVEPEITAAFDELADWFTDGLVVPAETPQSLTATPAAPIGFVMATGRSGRLVWWTGAAATIVALLFLMFAAGNPTSTPLGAAPPGEVPSEASNTARATLALARVVPFVMIAAATALVARGGGRSRRRVAGATLWGGSMATAVALTWWTAVVGNPNWFFAGRPGFGYSEFVPGLVVVAMVVLPIVGGLLARGRSGQGVLLAGVGFAVMGLVGAWGHDLALQTRLAVDEPAIRDAIRAELAADASSGCRSPSMAELPGSLGPVDQVCVAGGPDPQVRFVRITRGDDPSSVVRAGLLWEGGARGKSWNTCLRRILHVNQFVEYSSLIGGVECPANYTFTGAP